MVAIDFVLPKLITLETGIRFLSDYMLGNTYFRIDWESQNLDRARSQFEIVKQLENCESRLQQTINN